jgi:inosine-uridine nucleoside N-ribohydrolase
MKPIPKIVFDTDMGNDIDDALALLIACQATHKGQAELILVASSNPNEWAVPGIEAILRGYGLPDVPVGECSAKVGGDTGGFTEALAKKAGLSPGEATDAVVLLRKVLYDQPDGSVRIVPTGFSTNLAGLLESEANHKGDGIPLSGKELAEKKVEFVSIMAGNFKDRNHGEYNVAQNVPAFRKVIEEWPTPIVLSGYEIGIEVFSKWDQMKTTLSEHNIVRFGYQAYFKKHGDGPDWNRPSWDQTAMLYAIHPESAPFDLSEPVGIEVTDQGQTLEKPVPENLPARRHLKFSPDVPPEKVADILAALYTDPIQ